ncbi:MAG: TolC family protein [Rikenellaceae bacterium]|jgi:outer membrane protein TolC|nr:TolC family protein [Rikenellaceae bacterium]
MSKLLYLLATLFLASWANGVRAQSEERRALSIEELFALADSNNRSIMVAATAVDAAEENARIASNARLPSVDVSLSLSYNGNGSITDRNFRNSFVAPIPHFGNSFSLEASQVIFAGGAIRSGMRIAELQWQLAALDMERNRQEARFLIASNYLELCRLQNSSKVLGRNIAVTRQVLDNMRRRSSEGMALQNDVTRYELLLQNLSYDSIHLQNAISLTNNQLTVAVGLPSSIVIVPDSDGIEFEAGPEIDIFEALPVQIAQKSEEIARHAEKTSRAERLPQVALFVGDYLNGPVTIEIPALDKNFNYWVAGVGVKYNFGALYKSGAKIRASQLAAKRAAEEKAVAEERVALAAEAAQTHYREAFALLETKLKSVELAVQNYDVVSRRYANGLALIADLLDASAQRLDAELQAVDAQINIIYNYYKIKYIAGTL